MFFTQGKRGWTETWYADGNDPPTVLNSALKRICLRAVEFRAPLTTIDAIRFSVIGFPRNFVRTFPLQGVVSARTVTTGGEPDPVTTDAYYQVEGVTLVKRQLLLRGLLDSDVVRTSAGADIPSPALVQGVDNYLTTIYNAGWMIRQNQTPANSVAFTAVPIVSILPFGGSGGKVQVFTASSLALQQTPLIGMRVVGTSFKNDLPGFPTTTLIQSNGTTPSPYVIIQYRMRQTTEYFPSNALCYPLAYYYRAVTDWRFIRFGERKTGRPFGVPRGRSKVVVSRR